MERDKNNFCFTFVFALIILLFFSFRVEAKELREHRVMAFGLNECPEGHFAGLCEKKVWVDEEELKNLNWLSVEEKKESIKEKIKNFLNRFGGDKTKGNRKPKIKQRKFF